MYSTARAVGNLSPAAALAHGATRTVYFDFRGMAGWVQLQIICGASAVNGITAEFYRGYTEGTAETPSTRVYDTVPSVSLAAVNVPAGQQRRESAGLGEGTWKCVLTNTDGANDPTSVALTTEQYST